MSIKRIFLFLMVVLISVYFLSSAVLFYSMKKYMNSIKTIENLEKERDAVVGNITKYREGKKDFFLDDIKSNFARKFIQKLKNADGKDIFPDFMEYTISYHSKIRSIISYQNRLIYNAISLIILLQIMFIIGSFYGIFILYNRILQPIRGLKKILQDMEKNGRADLRVSYDIDDEMGEFVKYFNSIMDKMEMLIREKEDKIREHERIQKEINSLNEELQTTMEELQSSTEELMEKNEELKRLEMELEETNEKLREKLREEEEIARKKEKFMESILSSMDEGVIITDKNGKIEIVNRKCFTELGIINNASGRYIKDVIEISDPSWDYIISKIRENGEWGVETVLEQDNKEIPITIKGKMIYNETGEETNIIFILENLYGKKYIDDKLKEMQKLQSIGLIVSGLVHDFNNLLGVIKGGDLI